MKHLHDTADAGRDHIELAFNTRDYENQSNGKNIETRGFLSNDNGNARPRSNYVQRITIVLIFGLFGGLVIIMSVASATLNKVSNLKFPSIVTTAYPSLGLPGYESYSWNDVVSQSAGRDVNIMIDASVNSNHYYWITNYLAPKLAADYNINVKFTNVAPCPYTGANAQCGTADIVSLIKQNVAQNSDMSSGAYDIVWINGINFYNMKTNNLLYGPFSNKVPSSANFDFESDTLKYDFKVPTSGLEMPYGFAYNIFIYSVSATASALTPPLASSDVNTVLKIATWILTTGNGKFTYAAPAKWDATKNVVVGDSYDGAAFLKQAFYEVAGAGNAGTGAGTFCANYFSSTAAACAAALKYSYKDFTETDFSTIPAKYSAIAPYLFKFLRALEPNLYSDVTNYGGFANNYPTSATPSTASLTSKFTADFIWVMNTYSATTPSTLKDANNKYVGKGYVLSTGILSNSNYFAIPINAKNKLSALVAINYISSAAAMFERKSGQLTFPWSQYQAYDSTANEFTYKGGNWNVAFDTVPTLTNCVPRADLVDAKIPEPPVAYNSQLETDWYWCVLKHQANGALDPNTPPSVAARCG